MKLDLFFFLVIDDTLVCKIYITKFAISPESLKKNMGLDYYFFEKQIHTHARERERSSSTKTRHSTQTQ